MRPALPVARGLAWIVEGALLARRAGAAFVVACVWVGLFNAVPLISLFAALSMPVFYAGLMRLLATADAGGSATAGQVFAGFLEPGAFTRLLPILIVHVAFVFAVFALIVGAGGEELAALARTAQGGAKPSDAQTTAVAARIAPTLMALTPVALLVQWLEMLAVPRVMLDGVGGGAALRDAALAVLRQLWVLLVNALALVPVGMLVFMVFLLLIGVVVGLQATAPVLGALLQVPVMAGLAGAFAGIQAAVMYRAARDVFGAPEDSPTSTLPPDHIEV